MGEAAHIITEECVRLLCDTLSANFLGEKKLARQPSRMMNAYRQNKFRQHEISKGSVRIQRYLKVWDYSGNGIYRGFVTRASGDNTLFVFFEDHLTGQGLKSGYVLYSRSRFPLPRDHLLTEVQTNGSI